MTKSEIIITSRSDKSQIIDYPNPLFPCQSHKSFYTPDMTTIVPEHWHEELEFLYMIEGHLDYSVNGEKIKVNEGQGLIVNSRRIHSNISLMGDYAVFYIGLMNTSCMRTSSYLDKKYLFPLIGPNSFDYILLNQDDWTQILLEDMIPIFEEEDEDGHELKIVEACLRALRHISQHIKPDGVNGNVSSEYVRIFKDMATYIGENYADKISLEDIAMAGNIGKTLCAKIFKMLTSKTPGDYLIHYRISKSMELLEESDLSVTNIAYQTGFNSASHYTKTFHDIIGCTPNQYKLSIKGN